MTGSECRNKFNFRSTLNSVGKIGNALFLLGSSLLLLSGCGKKGASNLQEAEVLPGNAIIGKVDWIAMEKVSPHHIVYQKSQSVGLISIPLKESRCTAFLVSEDIVMTNWHCFPEEGDAQGARLYLDFLSGTNKNSFMTGDSYDCQEWLMANEALDVALLRCTGSPGRIHGNLTLEAKTDPRTQSGTIYVLHQNCDYYTEASCAPTKKVSIGTITDRADAPEPARSLDLFYTADTLGGSSGSPVLSGTTHRVVALHHNGHGQTFWSGGRGTRNSGVPMPQIIKYLKKYYPELNLATN